MPGMTLLCRNATTFNKAGELDEDAFRQFLQRFVDAKLGVYLASAGSGEGHSLTRGELSRVYRIGVEVCKGKVPVNSNQPEQMTAGDSIEHALLAIDAGIEVLNIYGPDGRHGYRPTDAEYFAYFDNIFKVIKHPVALCPNAIMGYMPSAKLIAAICHKYHQVESINLSGIKGDNYFINLKDALTRDVAIYVAYPGSLNTLNLGAAGLLGAEANIIPKTFRRYIDLYESKNFAEIGAVYEGISRFTEFTDRWKAASPRWIKMALKVLKLPGGEGAARDPYLPASPEEEKKFAEGLVRLRIPEIDEMAHKAGLAVPA